MCLPRAAEGMPGNARACGLMGGSLAVRKTSMTHRADRCAGSTILVMTVSWPCSLPSWYPHTSSFEATRCETVLQEPVTSRWLQGVISLCPTSRASLRTWLPCQCYPWGRARRLVGPVLLFVFSKPVLYVSRTHDWEKQRQRGRDKNHQTGEGRSRALSWGSGTGIFQ